jgi:hypothetical protein
MTDYVPGDLDELVRSAYQSAARTVRPEDLRRNSPMLAAGSVPRSRRRNMLVPFAAAAAVVVAVGASVAVPRLLAGGGPGSPGTPPASGISTSAPGHYPPFRVVLTVNDNNRSSALLVESAATGHVLSTAYPRSGYTWYAVSATGDTRKFVAAAGPSYTPYTPTRLYTLTLSASGIVTGVTELPGSPLPNELESMAASADGSTVAYTTTGTGDGYTYDVGVLRGGKTRQWTVSGVIGIGGLSVSDNGDILAFSTGGLPKHGLESALWVLSTASAPGSVTASARKLFDFTSVGGAGHAMAITGPVLFSPDGRQLYVTTADFSASGKTATRVTAYSTADGASLGEISNWDDGYWTELIPVGGLLLFWDPAAPDKENSDDTAYLLNPATRTRTILQLRGIPRAQFLDLAW